MRLRRAQPYTNLCDDRARIRLHTPPGRYPDCKFQTLKRTKSELARSSSQTINRAWCSTEAPPKQSTVHQAPPKQSSSRSLSLSCKLHIQSESPSNLACHAVKISSTSTSTLTSSTVLGWRFVVYLDSIAIDWDIPESVIHQPQFWQRVVCSFNMQDISHNNLMILAISWQPKPQSHISISDGLACDPSSGVGDFPHISFGVLRVPYELLPISANVRGGGTIQVPALRRWAFSRRNFHPIVLNWCRCRLCRCLCRCSTLHRCSAWTIPCNVPHLMASVAFLSIPPIGAATCMLLLVRTATIALTDTITGVPGHPSLLWIPLFALRPQLWEHGCHLRIIFQL